MKIWITLIIFGIILFFVGVVYNTTTGRGMLMIFGSVVLVAVGILSGLSRGFNRMMTE